MCYLKEDRDMFRATRPSDDDREPNTFSKAPDIERSNSKKLFSVADAAEVLAISRKHVYALINRGELSTVAIGRRRLIVNDELDRYIAKLVNEAW
jgi:excisionase family DNA binding protein